MPEEQPAGELDYEDGNLAHLDDHRLTPRADTRRKPGKREKVRMTAHERREQLVAVGSRLFAEKGFEAVTVEEVAAKADVSKPVVYEHFGGKEGLYAVIVDREMSYLLSSISSALEDAGADRDPRALLERGGLALFDYIATYPDGFRILLRDTPRPTDGAPESRGSFASVIIDVASQVEKLLSEQFDAHKVNKKLAPMYARMLVGMVAMTGEWWLDVRKPAKEEVVAHLVNLAWRGLGHMDAKPSLGRD
jgi:AcrR family transcriptional regulator